MKKHTLQTAFIKNAGLGSKLDDITEEIVHSPITHHILGGTGIGAVLGKATHSVIQSIKKPKKFLGVFKPRRYQRLINALDSFKNRKGIAPGAIIGGLTGLMTGAIDKDLRGMG